MRNNGQAPCARSRPPPLSRQETPEARGLTSLTAAAETPKSVLTLMSQRLVRGTCLSRVPTPCLCPLVSFFPVLSRDRPGLPSALSRRGLGWTPGLPPGVALVDPGVDQCRDTGPISESSVTKPTTRRQQLEYRCAETGVQVLWCSTDSLDRDDSDICGSPEAHRSNRPFGPRNKRASVPGPARRERPGPRREFPAPLPRPVRTSRDNCR